MLKQKVHLKKYVTARVVAIVIVLAGLAGGALVAPLVKADQFDDQINQLNQLNAQNQATNTQLRVQANTYSEAVAGLRAQISVLQGQIDVTKAKIEDLKNQITTAETELERQKKILGENIKAMYLEGQISTLEMLASSKNLSEYLDKQQYRNAIQNKIQDTLDKITALKLQLKKQKESVEATLKDQQTIQATLDGQRAEQSRLLSLNQEQQSAYEGQIRQNNSKISDLRRQQLIANARFIGGPAGTGPACGGGYPGKWCNIPQDSVIDDWGMYNRECVSYTAFRVAASGRHMPYWGGNGDAYLWDDNARAAGIPVDGNPSVGDIAQTDRGGLGHVMYVEHVYGDGTILISQYNAGLDGRYSEKRISAAGLNFIHF